MPAIRIGWIALAVALCGGSWNAAAFGQEAGPKADEKAAAEVGELAHAAGAAQANHGKIGSELHLLTIAPFAILLLCIAILPLAYGHWWEHNSNKGIVVALLAVPLAVYLIYFYGTPALHGLVEKLEEYASFMILLASLYIISGGIYVRGSLNGTPLANTGLLAIGAVIASLVGTTGASVLLIRPLLRANKTRVEKAHIVIFFIFVVSNCGGLLTPLGDPPLFMGFLKGVPFQWTMIHLWPQWAGVNLLLLVIFNVWDQIVFDREEKQRPGSQLEEVMQHEPFRIEGLLNFIFLAGIVATIFCAGQGYLFSPTGKYYQEGLMLLLAIAAYFTTNPANRANNKFTFGPIIEVAVLFIGIFITMAPALLILNAWGQNARPDLGRLALDRPWHFFWASGILSSFLDNAPTYMTMAATACGLKGVTAGDTPYLREFLAQGATAVSLLAAISCGSVFMGANTYIGNGPNFMVKAIAEENGVKMPSFFGYMAYSGCVLIPIFLVLTMVMVFFGW